ncbi:dimethylarginine dimethylaminohydrolase family protein [Hyphococcus sp.]|uniref:dimethylarginine dimethylaminohydrolase family protein n=1 Tax=Hyphococcus sp. TaxID=2038636 RepID=UPI002085C6AF|nr:MAG: NG,NG-dimethylarginine dimethylaminohydrolase protein [Marinicaulis sp.]
MSGHIAPFHFTDAVVRRPAKSVTAGLRAIDHGAPTYQGVAAEHDAYVAALRAAGVEVTVLPALEQFPDSIFVEDPALVFAEGAILMRPGTPSRLDEVREIAPTLHDMFEVVLELPSPGCAEGGDILTTSKAVMIGMSDRTDLNGAKGLQSCLEKFGRESRIVETPPGVLHFKTDCSMLDEETILTTKRLAASGVFDEFETVFIPDGEEAAANALRVNDVVMVGSDFPRTIELLDKSGYEVVPLATSQIGKIDAGLSCMSLRWRRV